MEPTNPMYLPKTKKPSELLAGKIEQVKRKVEQKKVTKGKIKSRLHKLTREKSRALIKEFYLDFFDFKEPKQKWQRDEMIQAKTLIACAAIYLIDDVSHSIVENMTKGVLLELGATQVNWNNCMFWKGIRRKDMKDVAKKIRSR